MRRRGRKVGNVKRRGSKGSEKRGSRLIATSKVGDRMKGEVGEVSRGEVEEVRRREAEDEEGEEVSRGSEERVVGEVKRSEEHNV